MVFPEDEYDSSSFGFSDGRYTFTHKAYGADMFRYSWNFGMNWTTWKNWEDTTYIEPNVFTTSDNWWDGDHIMVQCMLYFLLVLVTKCSKPTRLESSHNVSRSGSSRQLQLRWRETTCTPILGSGPIQQLGLRQGITSEMKHNADGKWELKIMASWPTYV